MKQKMMLCLLLLIGFKTIAQIQYEKGYFINQSNQKVECLIKNENWDIENSSFTYKLSNEQVEETKSFGEINEISIYNILKYKKYNVDIDVNVTNDVKNLKSNREVKLANVDVFLKVLIEGQVSLYQYEAQNFIYFFYSTDKLKSPTQLLHKKYRGNDDGLTIREFNDYKQVLAKEFDCDKKSISNLDRINYNETSLVRFFKKYLQCDNQNYTPYDEYSNKRKSFYVKLKGGVSFSNLTLERPALNIFDFGFEVNYDSKILPVFGFELEYFLPTKGNNLSIFIDPKIRSAYQDEKIATTNGGGQMENIQIKYSSLEFPINVRYYLFLNSQSKISFNLGVIFENSFNSSVDFEVVRNAIFDDFKKINTKYTPVFGVGYHIDKYAIELRYSNRDIFESSPIFRTGFQNIDLTFSYTLF